MYLKFETQPRQELEKEQLSKINHILSHVKNTPYYKDKLPDKISSLEEFSKLPLISKEDLRKAFPYGFLSCEKEKIVRINASSGTTGIPTLSYITKKDLENFTQNEALQFSHAGIKVGDVLQCMVGFNLFTAGWGCYQGLIELGATIIPTGPGNTQRQINILKQLKANYLYSNPSYLQYFLETISENERKEISVKTAITAGEVLTSEFQKLAKEKYGIEVYNFYGMTEFANHIASECSCHNGLHINENCFYAEIINPETGEVLPDNEYGELVLTDLNREGMPLIRYRTHDYTRIIPGTCSCGRTHKRIEAIKCRIDDMMIINGVNVYPSQIEECIYSNISTATNFLIKVSEHSGLKKVSIDIELPQQILKNKSELKKIKRALNKSLKSIIIITPILNFISTGTLLEQQGKTRRVIFNSK